MDPFKNHSVCLVNVINPSTKPVVGAQANAILWLLKVRLELRWT